MIAALLLLAARPRIAVRVNTPATRIVRSPSRAVPRERSWAVRVVLSWRR